MKNSERIQLTAEIEELKIRLLEAEETLDAIRNHEVDALVIDGPEGQQVFTLEGAEKLYRTIIEAMSEGACTIAEDGTILYANNQFSRLFERPLNQIIGTSIQDLLGPADSQRLRDMLDECKYDVCRKEFLLKASSGREVPVSLSASQIDQGDVNTFCIVATDLTEQKRSYRALEKEIRQRKEVEAHLVRVQKFEALGTLSAGIAHDFNNVLSSIFGFTEMAIEDAGEHPQIAKSLSNVLKSAKRGRDLVKQILAFSRKTSHDRNPLSLTPVLKESIAMLRASTPATVEIKFSSTAQSDTVITSPIEVQQIVMNLATNALMAMEEKGGILEIALSDISDPASPDTEARSGAFLQLTVTDTGAGMTPEVLQKAFDPFFTTKEPGKGTGMGLAVVYGIVKNLNGTITALSTVGEGTTFKIFLPKAEIEADKIKEENIPGIQGGKETILFVEDEELINEWGTTILEKLGYTVYAFRDPQEALQTFSLYLKSFDLVITDQSMPKMAGSDLAAKIHSLKEDIPILLCTGHAEAVPPEKASESGITDVIIKPLTKREFASAIRRVLDKRQ